MSLPVRFPAFATLVRDALQDRVLGDRRIIETLAGQDVLVLVLDDGSAFALTVQRVRDRREDDLDPAGAADPA